MTTAEMKRIAALLFQATNEKDSSLIEPYLAEKLIWHDGCDGMTGADVVFEWPKQDFLNGNVLGKGGSPKEKSIVMQIAEDDKVFTYFTVMMTHNSGDLFGYPPTGRKVRYNAQYTTRFEDNLIVEVWATADGHVALKQMGILD